MEESVKTILSTFPQKALIPVYQLPYRKSVITKLFPRHSRENGNPA